MEPITPQPRAFLFGGGHISQALARIAGLAGFSTVVVGDRAAFANPEQFPDADENVSDGIRMATAMMVCMPGAWQLTSCAASVSGGC